MKTVSLKIDEEIFEDTEKIRSEIKKSRNRYINEAIDHYNLIQKRAILEKQLSRESKMVKEDSINILRDFEKVEYGD